jgi:hypothetical protein
MSARRAIRPVVVDLRRMFTREWAAAYVSLTEAQFEAEVVAGALPEPVMHAGVELWDRLAIDEALNRQRGAETDWRGRSKLYGGDRPGLR